LVGLYLAVNAVFAGLYLIDPAGVLNLHGGNFLDAFFFSVQTMATIGYGRMVPLSVYDNALVTTEALVGLLSMAMATGLMFAKFSRPTARVLFSRQVAVHPREGVRSVVVRMANERANMVVEATLRLTLLRDEITLEGEPIRKLYDLKLARGNTAAFALTWTAYHPITPDSPIYGATAESLKAVNAQLVASLVGIDETFSQTVHARHSWTADEIAWDVKFVDILTRTPEGMVIDYRRFHETKPA
jgi:inward rectifier potassium channel